MPVIVGLRNDIEHYLQKHGIWKKWEKAKLLFENNPSHPSLNTELLEPKHRLIYSFRIDKKYRALFIYLPDDKVEIISVTKHTMVSKNFHAASTTYSTSSFATSLFAYSIQAATSS